MVFYVLACLVQYAIAFGLALLLNAEIRARKFFRVAFLLPFMLSPVAVSWMIGKSLMEYRFGPVATLARHLGWDSPAFFTTPGSPGSASWRMDAWVWIPFIMILLLAGLQALPKEISEAAKVDGATPWQSFWQITFPLMLPVSVTAIVLKIIFQLKLADIVINVTSGGPGGRHRHGVELHFPRISRPLQCRLRHHAGGVLSGDDHHIHHAAAASRQPLDEESDLRSKPVGHIRGHT